MIERNRNIVGIIFAMIASLALACVSIRIWEIDINIPIGSYGDGVLATTIFKSIYENGWMGAYFCDSLGAPDVASLIDTPFFDNGMIAIACVLSKILPNANMVFYVDYLMTYVLAAVSMYLLLNCMTKDVILKIILSISFAITPYHFYRGMGHITLSHYYVVPIAIYLALVIYEEAFCYAIPEKYRNKKLKSVGLYLGCIVLGMSNVYYAYFGVLCMGIALLLKLVKTRTVTVLYKEALLIYTVLASVFVGLLPKLIYAAKYGANTMAGVRGQWEVEIYALKIIQLLLPCSYNRVKLLADLNAKYSSYQYNINENSFASLGIIATIGFLMACYSVICLVAKRENKDDRKNFLSFLILFLVLYSMAGGFGAFINYFITPEIRCLNRTSIVIVCISLCIVSLLWDGIGKKKRILKDTVFAAILVFSMYSEIMVMGSGWQVQAKNENAVLNKFFAEVEKSAGEDGMIYELPFMIFPETNAINEMQDYEPAIGYLYTTNLKWSYGGIRGRNTTAQNLLIDDGFSERFLYRIKEAGFNGVYIDTKGYADRGVAIIDFYSNYMGLTPIVSDDNWLYYYDISNVKISEEVNHPWYQYVNEFIHKNGLRIGEKEKENVLSKLAKESSSASQTVYKWLMMAGYEVDIYEAKDYVRFLYNEFLTREPSQDEMNLWLEQIDNGLEYEEVLGGFLYSDEFKSSHQIQ